MSRRNKGKYDNNKKSNTEPCNGNSQNNESYNSYSNSDRNNYSADRTSKRKINKGSNEKVNDAKWYINNPELLNQVAGYNMNNVIGIPTTFNYNSMVEPREVPEMWLLHVPSIMTLYMNPCPGYTTRNEESIRKAAINMAGRKLYAEISSVNSKTTQYQPQDLVFAMLAVGEVISMVSHATRIYGVAFNYSRRNRAIPNTMLKALGVDPSSLAGNLAAYRLRLNKLLVSANQITMFSNIPYFQKCWNLYANIYTDSDSSMSQMYTYVPYSTWILNEEAAGGTKLQTELIDPDLVKGQTPLVSASRILDILEQQIDSLLTSTTYNYIYTDILSYVGKKGGTLYSFGYVSEMYRVLPIYNYEALLQIHNAVAIDAPTTNDVTQDVNLNGVVYYPEFEGDRANKFSDHIVDFPMNGNPSAEEKLNALMYQSSLSAGTANSDGTILVADAALPDHYVVRFGVFVDSTSYTITSTLSLSGEIGFVTDTLAHHSRFDWAPFIYLVSTDKMTMKTIVGDLNFYDSLPYRTIKDVYDYAFLGLFDLS